MQVKIDRQTSGQVDPKCNITNIPFVINGCTVSFSSNKRTDDPIEAVKEILLTAYRSRIARC